MVEGTWSKSEFGVDVKRVLFRVAIFLWIGRLLPRTIINESEWSIIQVFA